MMASRAFSSEAIDGPGSGLVAPPRIVRESAVLHSSATVLPGLLLAATVAALARLANAALPEAWAASISEILLAVLIGLGVRRFVPWRSVLDPGVRFAFHTVLRAAIVVLGVRFSLAEVGSIGGQALALVVLTMTVALVVAHRLGRALGIDGRLCTLIGVGTAVCGNSAISATAPAIGARDEDLTYAVAVNTLFGTIAVFTYPLLGTALAMGASTYGTWVGAAVNDTSQVVATGFAHGDRAGEIATAVKLTRNALMGFVIALAAWVHAGAGAARAMPWPVRLKASVPGFVLGFLFVSLLGTVGVIEAAGQAIGRDLARDGAAIAKILVLIALAGVGLGTRLHSLRAIGPRPLVLGLVTASVTSLLALVWISVMGGAG